MKKKHEGSSAPNGRAPGVPFALPELEQVTGSFHITACRNPECPVAGAHFNAFSSRYPGMYVALERPEILAQFMGEIVDATLAGVGSPYRVETARTFSRVLRPGARGEKLV